MALRFPANPLRRPPRAVAVAGYGSSLSHEVSQLVSEVAQVQRAVLRAAGQTPETLCMAGSRTFAPDGQSFLCDSAQNGTSSRLVNYIVRDGESYDIAVQMAGPGVFVVESILVACFQRLYIPAYGAPCWFPMVPNVMVLPSTGGVIPTLRGTRRFSLYPLQPAGGANNTAGGTGWPSVGFVWNFADPLSGRRLSDEWLADGVLLPQTQPSSEAPNYTGRFIDDGGRFDLPVGWAFKAGTRAILNWRPISPVLQFDSSIAGNAAGVGLPGLPFDDRESNVRDQSVRVDVELFGYRYSEGA